MRFNVMKLVIDGTLGIQMMGLWDGLLLCNLSPALIYIGESFACSLVRHQGKVRIYWLWRWIGQSSSPVTGSSRCKFVRRESEKEINLISAFPLSLEFTNLSSHTPWVNRHSHSTSVLLMLNKNICSLAKMLNYPLFAKLTMLWWWQVSVAA